MNRLFGIVREYRMLMIIKSGIVHKYRILMTLKSGTVHKNKPKKVYTIR